MTPSSGRQRATLPRKILLPVAPDFDFWSTVYSHGWCSLAPFHCDPERRTLTCVLSLGKPGIVRCELSDTVGAVQVRYESDRPLNPADKRMLLAGLSSCLRLGENFRQFHRSMGPDPDYRWIARRRAGRLLRAPTVFEDLVKMICTTNCTWALTTIMVNNLVQLFGRASAKGWRTFPDPESLAGSSEAFLRKNVKAGYRSPYLLELSETVAAGRLDPEAWRRDQYTIEDLLGLLLSIKGVGRYAAENMLKLLGHYDHLGLDSWVRSKYFSLYHGGRRVTDRTINGRYRRFGAWRGLVFWLEMTRDWHEEKFSTG